jgi:hypothetical protein
MATKSYHGQTALDIKPIGCFWEVWKLTENIVLTFLTTKHILAIAPTRGGQLI